MFIGSNIGGTTNGEDVMRNNNDGNANNLITHVITMTSLDTFQEASWASTVNVHIQVSFTKIYDVDTINQRFQAEAIIESQWHDPHVTSMEQEINASEIWKPELYVENAINDVKEEITYRVVPANSQSENKVYMTCEIRKVRGLFYENLELENFPLDVQDLSLTIATKKPGKIVNFIPLQPGIHRLKISHTLDKSMWHMHNILITRKDKITREYSYGKRQYNAVRVTAQVFRLPGFFYWNAILPILLVSMASLCPFVIDVKLPQSRLPSTATMLLTSVSIRWIVGRLLPTVSYLTSLDKYSLGTMMIITLQLLYHATMAAIFPSLPELIAYRIDKAAFGCFVSLILSKQIAFILWVRKVTKYRKLVKENKTIHMIEEDSDESEEEEYDNVPSIEKEKPKINKSKIMKFIFKNKKSQTKSPVTDV